ncbi:MAG: prenyltransferase [Cytophagales bacterium]|nr:MAG: prenyltransferase [Cytophagales bacterium]
MTAYLKLIRPHQWVKNLFIFVPAFFAHNLFDVNTLIPLILGFVSFSAVASSIYILNDYKDIATDKLHPEKRKRPLASGLASPSIALTLMVVLVFFGFGVSSMLPRMFSFILLLYFILNIGYSLGLKNISILDVLIVAFGFLLRAVSGGIVISIAISQWLIIMVFLLAIFLAIAKRRDDVKMYLLSGKSMRKSIAEYNLEFVNTSLSMLCGVIIVAYLMYTLSPDVQTRMNSDNIYLTTIFVIAGMLRYLQITFVENNSGSPTKILYSDKFIIFTILFWLLSFYIIIYLPHYIK